jgi:type VI protein secretion system component Hcp
MSKSKAIILTCVASTLALACQESDSIETPAKAQEPLTGSLVISGTVASSKGPVSGATIKLTGGETRTAFSDSTGKYSIPGLGNGSYTLSATGATNCATVAPTQLNNMSSSVTLNLALEGTGCANLTVVTGPTGPTGPVGAAGPAGGTGATGAQGVAGPAGTPGVTGPAGPIGPIGPIGQTGLMGPAGPQGVGIQGPAGPQGAQGPAGPAGPAGPPGSGSSTGLGSGATGCDSFINLPPGKLDTFLKIDDIKGDSVDGEHKDEIDVVQFSWAGICREGATSKPEFQPLVVLKETDRATVPLLRAAASGKHLDYAILTVRKAGDKPFEFLTLEFNDILITGGGDRLTFTYGQIKVTETPQKDDGSAGPSIQFAWDILGNKEL